MENPRTTGLARLASGALALVDPTGKAQVWRCDWQVEVASGNPEPDFPSDCYRIVDCGAKVRPHAGFPLAPLGEATICDHGHDRISLAVRDGLTTCGVGGCLGAYPCVRHSSD